MLKTVTTKRSWQLAPFHQFEVAQATTDVPEQVVNDVKALNLIYVEQLAEVELQYQKYIKMLEDLEGQTTDEKIEYLNTLRKESNQKFIEYLAKEK